jgi:hypothetical protein
MQQISERRSGRMARWFFAIAPIMLCLACAVSETRAWADETVGPPALAGSVSPQQMTPDRLPVRASRPFRPIDGRTLAVGLRDAVKSSCIPSSGFHLIGSLVKGASWKRELPLSDQQIRVLAMLDQLTWDAHARSMLADADELDGNPPDFVERFNQGIARRQAAITHAQQMVFSALLTQSQAAVVLHSELAFRRWNALYENVVCDWLGVTEIQKARLDQIGDQSAQDESDWPNFAPDHKNLQAALAVIWCKRETAVKHVLTPDQLAKWSRLGASQPAPRRPVNLARIASQQADVPRINVADLSSIFRFTPLHANTLALSAEQQRLLKTLEEVTGLGPTWIDLGALEETNPRESDSQERQDQRSKKRTVFLNHVEQFALLGILTSQQAQRVEAARAERSN